MEINFTCTDRFTVIADDPTTHERVEWTATEAIPLEMALDKVRKYLDWGFQTATVTSATTGELIVEATRDEHDELFEEAEVYIDYLFEVVDEDSEFCGEEFLVEVQSGIDSFKEARAIAEVNFPNVKLKAYGPYSVEEAEAWGLDTY